MPTTGQTGQGPPDSGSPGPGARAAGVPPIAQSRLAELRQTHSWGSSLGVSEFAAISKVGFQPLGQVLGAAVYNIGDAGDEECPYGVAVYRGEGNRAYQPPGSGIRLGPAPVQPPVGAAAIGSARPLVSVLYQARRAAISRMTAECTALGGLGVIGVTLTVGAFGDDEDILEFRAFGTAVRAAGVVSRAQPFASDLSGQDFTKLVAHGYVPVGLALGVAVGYRHDDWLTKGQTRVTAGNVEVVGYSELVRQMRTDARNELELDLVRMGAEGVVVREMSTRITERKCPIVPFGKDHVVEASIVGTAIAQFARMEPPPIYGIHKLDGRRPVQPPERQVSVSLDGGESGETGEPGEPTPPAAGSGGDAPG
ncbi:MAG TPA: heavy metal-binding domain-containing protein [Streptosporangiaceae bacterium]|nr:heavy metal-binding domain-containing protein [Streptosporangiaceae bacterium]